ncbi:hypothetical protein [Marinobacterium jannaschii]|uniref:hypothetical protein n=1 Tax=Marinobacterium jannaschii TaxID=64970 RepID=UPI00048710A1|nr:hypothetical protein [Marinobacterium jannaschii]
MKQILTVGFILFVLIAAALPLGVRAQQVDMRQNDHRSFSYERPENYIDAIKAMAVHSIWLTSVKYSICRDSGYQPGEPSIWR